MYLHKVSGGSKKGVAESTEMEQIYIPGFT